MPLLVWRKSHDIEMCGSKIMSMCGHRELRSRFPRLMLFCFTHCVSDIRVMQGVGVYLGGTLPPVRCLLHLTYHSRDFQSPMIIPLLQDGIIHEPLFLDRRALRSHCLLWPTVDFFTTVM